MQTIIILLIAGALLLLSELILPGGIAGIAGLICVGIGVAMSYSTFGAMVGNIVLLLSIVALIIGIIFWFRFFPNSRMGKLFVSSSKVGNAGYTFDDLLKKTGRTVTPLRPSGIVEISDKRWDVVSEGAFIENDVLVKVIKVEGNRIVVRPELETAEPV